MSSSLKKITDQLRQKTKYCLINNNIHVHKDSLNCIFKNNVPLMCDFVEHKNLTSYVAYESGNRSIFFNKHNSWIKAKGIGIPVGYTRPLYYKENIYTYQLRDPNMCHESIIWGFMEKDELNCELYGAMKAEELGQKVTLLGYTSFPNVYYLKMKDRAELFYKLKSTNINERLRNFKNGAKKTTVYSIFYSVPSDIRVQELLCTFIFPQITKIIDKKDIREYIQWIGSSCGFLLKEFHDSGALHGTWFENRNEGIRLLGLIDIHTNCYTGNYLVDEEGITMCDFDLSRPIQKESYREIEKWALIHTENPLYYAGSYSPNDALYQKIAIKNPFRESLSVLFEKSVKQGYKGEKYEVEGAWKREMLSLISRAKVFLWNLYGIPKEITAQIDYLDYILTLKTVNQKDFNKAFSDFDF